MADVFQYPKKRKEFGRHAQFDDTDTKIVGNVQPDVQSENFIKVNPNRLVLSNLPELSHHQVSYRNIPR